MTKKELKKFVEVVETQFNNNKNQIIDGYEQYLSEAYDKQYKTLCIESFGVVMVAEHNKELGYDDAFKCLYNFIHSFRGFAKTRPQYAFDQKPECSIEYYTDNLLMQCESLGVKKVLEALID